MGFFEWLTRSAERELDRRVAGSEGVAHGRLTGLDDDEDLLVRAAIAQPHQGRVTLRAGERREEGEEGALACNLGPGRHLRQSELLVEAEVVAAAAASSALAVLTVELRQSAARPLETHSVESRFDTGGRAALKIVIELG